MDILQYFNENASKEEWKLVQYVYNRELVELLKELNLAELSVIYTRICLEKELQIEKIYDQEYGYGLYSDIKARYIDDMRDELEEYEEEENNG